MSHVLTQIYEHESFFTLSFVRGSIFITTQAWNNTGTQESFRTTHHRAIFSSVVSKSEGPRPLIVAHGADKLRSSSMEHPEPEQIELSSAVHVAFEQLEPRNLPLHLPL
jgi:hypothetical protein